MSGDQIAVLHHRQGHAVNIGLLESSLADHRLNHLAGNRYQRHRVHIRIRNAGNQVGRSGTAGGHADARFARGARIPFGRKSPTLLMARQHRANFRTRQRLMDLDARPARIGENGVHPLALKAGDKDFAAGHRGPNFHVSAGALSKFRSFCSYYVSCGSSCGRRCIKKPTTVLQPWVLVEILLILDKRQRRRHLRRRPAERLVDSLTFV